MRKNRFLTMSPLLCSLLLGTNPCAQAATTYHGFTRLDPVSKTVIEDAYIVVEGERIAQVGRGSLPQRKDWQYVDMRGRFALPGFFDVHAHITAGPLTVEVKNGVVSMGMKSIDNVTRFHSLVALAFGITTIRNPAGDPNANAKYDQKRQAGKWLGPEALHSGSTLDPVPIAGLSVYPKDEEGWNREINRGKHLGMRYIKLYTGLNEKEIALGVEVAHAHGMKAIAHLDRVSWTRAIELGVDALTHALPTSADLLVEPKRREYVASRERPDSKFTYQWFELADYDSAPMQEPIHLLADRRIPVDLTLLVNEIVYFFDEVDSVLPVKDRQYIHPLVMKTLFQNFGASHTGWNEEDYRRAHSVMPKVLELARRFHEAGVPLFLGTDGAGGGPFYARELALHVQAGIPVWNVLQLATNLAARRLGVADRTGTIAPGKEADIVFLKSNPLENIANVRDVDMVISNGQAHRFDELIALTAAFRPE